MKYYLFIFLLSLNCPTAYSGGLPVYSALEHTTGILSRLEFLNDAAVQLEKLGVMDAQLMTEIEALIVQTERFNREIRNATRLYGQIATVADGDLVDILTNTNRLLNRFRNLDPRNPVYEKLIKHTLDEEYGLAPIENEEALDSVPDAEISARVLQRERIEAKIRRDSARAQLTEDRSEGITDYAERIENLDSDSMLETTQINAGQLNLLLSQQEEIIDRLNDSEQRALDDEIARARSTRNFRQNYVDRVNETKNRPPLGTNLR